MKTRLLNANRGRMRWMSVWAPVSVAGRLLRSMAGGVNIQTGWPSGRLGSRMAVIVVNWLAGRLADRHTQAGQREWYLHVR